MIRRSSQPHRSRTSGGFSTIELALVVAVMMIVGVIALPSIQRQLQLYSLRSAVAATTSVIQSTRYQAIFHGCQYQLAFNAGGPNYAIANMNPAAGGTTCQAAFGPPSAAIPLPGNGAVTLNTNLTLVFHPSGLIQATVGPNPIQFTLAYPGLQTETLRVSNYGNINVSIP
jgi:type II secretory pathway pseudopilin PulG